MGAFARQVIYNRQVTPVRQTENIEDSQTISKKEFLSDTRKFQNEFLWMSIQGRIEDC